MKQNTVSFHFTATPHAQTDLTKDKCSDVSEASPGSYVVHQLP